MVDLSHGGEISCIPLGQSELKFYRPTDFDILFLFKTTFLNSRLESPIHSLLNEFYIRQFKTSLWKSYAEYKIFFSSFTAEEIRKVIEIIKKDSYKGITQNYGTINDPTLERRFALLGMKNVVWVDGRSKLKKLNPQNTFILFKDCVRTYQSISTQNELLEDQQSLDVIYLYYNLVDGKKIEKPLVKKMFKELISDIPG